MEEIKCPNPNCKQKIAEVEGMSITFEEGIKPFQQNCSGGFFVFAFDCPHCQRGQIVSIVLES